MQKIRKNWDDQNKNLHNYLSFIQDPVSLECGLDFWGHEDDYNLCPAVTVAEKYNLTLLEFAGYDHVFLGSRSFGILYATRYLDEGHRGESIYQVVRQPINFVTIANHPLHSARVEAFLSLFDTESWVCLLISIITISGFLTFLLLREAAKDFSWLLWVHVIVDKVIIISCILLGQVGSSSTKAYQTRKVALVLLTVWIFGNFFLMVNFYQGSIYSCLAVLLPPKSPLGVEDLVNWNIPIVDMHTVLWDGDLPPQSYLLDDLIPTLISGSGDNPKFSQFLNEFRRKLLPISNNSVSDMVDSINFPNSTGTNPMIVLLNAEADLEDFVKIIKLAETRIIVVNRGYSPFEFIGTKSGSRNLFTRYFLKDWIHLRESGLINMWDKVDNAAFLSEYNEELLENGMYFKAVQPTFGNIREPVTFHESRTVSMELILLAFSLSGVVMGFGVLGFLVENKKTFIRWGKIAIYALVNSVRHIFRMSEVRIVSQISKIFKTRTTVINVAGISPD